jgi:hypothetical protein
MSKSIDEKILAGTIRPDRDNKQPAVAEILTKVPSPLIIFTNV